MLSKLNFKKKLSFLKSIDRLRGIIANTDRQPILMEKTDILPVLVGIELILTVDDVFGSINLISRRYLTTL
jgi:hypothetical protein